MYGYETPEDILRMDSILPLIAPHEHDRFAQYYDIRLQGGDAPTHYEHQAIRKDGTSFWVESQVRVVTWEGTLAVQGTNVDVTHHKQAEEALQESETRYKTLIEKSLQGISITRRGIRLYANDALAKMFGYDRAEEMIGQKGIHVKRDTLASVIYSEELKFR